MMLCALMLLWRGTRARWCKSLDMIYHDNMEAATFNTVIIIDILWYPSTRRQFTCAVATLLCPSGRTIEAYVGPPPWSPSTLRCCDTVRSCGVRRIRFMFHRFCLMLNLITFTQFLLIYSASLCHVIITWINCVRTCVCLFVRVRVCVWVCVCVCVCVKKGWSLTWSWRVR